MEPSSSMVYSAEMLSCRNRPSGSFFCSAYHFPAYCNEKEPGARSERVLLFNTHAVDEFEFTHPLGVKVPFDCEAVDDTGGREAVLHAGQQDQQQGRFRGCHSERKQSTSVFSI